MRAGPPPRRQQIASIVTMVLMLIMIITMRRTCAEGTASMFKQMEVRPDAGAAK